MKLWNAQEKMIETNPSGVVVRLFSSKPKNQNESNKL